ncbi:transposase [Bradyrhizobium sp. 30]|uniref:transposase n=1 Tax=Bradyrhizobium sp. 30 TaxID=2782669 RepID=UPI001FF7F5B9|nr:transposase [Bradyrhizobium sp. 30]
MSCRADPAELRDFAAALLDRCARLERLLKLAKDAQFGRSSEKLDADQLQLVLEDIDQAARPSKQPKIVPIPKHARRELPSAEPIVVSCRSICRASSKP